MTRSKPYLEAAINGSRTRTDYRGVPITAEELATDAVAAVRAGADAIHFHIRSEDGAETLNRLDLSNALAKMRSALPNVPLGVSTAGWIMNDSRARHAAIAAWNVLPDFASVNLQEDEAMGLIKLLLERGIGIEAGLADVSDAETLIRSGLASACLRILVEPQERSIEAARNTALEVIASLTAAAITQPILLHGVDETAWALFDEAAARGLDVRMGLEDTLVMPNAKRAESNAALISEAYRRLRLT
jgi:uncharacterized protein (DUF849 family)